MSAPPPAGSVRPDDMFACLLYSATLSYRRCLERRVAEVSHAARLTKGEKMRFPACARECAQGRRNAELVQLEVRPAPPPKRTPPRLDLVNAVQMSAPRRAPKEESMPRELKSGPPCSVCGKAIRSDNKRGAHSACLTTAGKPKTSAVAAAKGGPRAPKQRAAPFESAIVSALGRASAAGVLPPPASLSTEDLVRYSRSLRDEIARRRKLLDGALEEERDERQGAVA